MSESSSPNTLNDQTLLDLYTRFQGERRSLGAIYPFPLRDDFLDRAHPPAMSMVPVEGLPSIDASFAMDAVAVVQ